jgi:anaerobic selenocysteine-containing dehydrogenase
MTAAGIRTVRSFCRVCTSVCGILVEVDGDEVTRVRGDRDHPLSQGYTCPKGRALPQLHHHPDRIEQPQMRIDGALRATTWESCLDDLGTRVRDIIDRHGPASVGIFFGTGLGMDAAGWRTAEALQAAIGTPAKFSPMTIDGTAKPLIADLVGGSIGLSGRPDYDNADFVIFVGTNPVISHGHAIAIPNPTGTVRDLATRGQVWVIDPRRTETARLATGHLAPRPGTDYAVLAYLVREILRGDAVEHHAVGCEALAAAVAPFTLEHTAQIVDVGEKELTRLYSAVRGARRIAIETGTGVTMTASAANVTQWLAWALMILTDSMNRPGGTWFHPGFAYQLEAFELPISPSSDLPAWTASREPRGVFCNLLLSSRCLFSRLGRTLGLLCGLTLCVLRPTRRTPRLNAEHRGHDDRQPGRHDIAPMPRQPVQQRVTPVRHASNVSRISLDFPLPRAIAWTHGRR